MTGLLDRLLTFRGPGVYALIAPVVFAEDALFVGFVPSPGTRSAMRPDGTSASRLGQ